jgi:alpha-tubulin suppressor-like RCC1 family protein
LVSVNAETLFSANFNEFTGSPTGTQYQTGLPIVSGASPAGWDKVGPDAVTMVNHGTTAANWAVMIHNTDSITLTSGINADESGVAYRVSFDLGGTVGSNSSSATQTGDKLMLSVVDDGNDGVGDAVMEPGTWTGTQTFTRRSFNYLGTGRGPIRLRVDNHPLNEPGARFVGAIDNIAITPFADNLISGPTKITATTTIPLNGGVGAVSEIVDGLDLNSDGTGGFGPNASTGVIVLTLDQAYDLESFILANGINGSGDGIAPFNLVFKNAAGGVILRKDGLNSTSSGGPAEEFNFASPILGVKQVDLEITDVRFGRIEIREVAFRSVPATASVAKTTPTISAAPTASTISYGESLGASTLTGGTASVPGTFAFKTPATTPNAGLAQNFKVVFTPTDTANYELVEIDVPVTVNKAAATVNVSDLNQVYNGSPRPVTVTTVPASLAISVQYNGGATVPTNAGSYPVQVTVTDANHTGAKSEVLTIAKADLLLSALPTASAITYGQTLTASTLSGGQAKLGTDVVAGSFAFTTPTAAPGAGPASQGVTFTPTDITNYNPATTTVSVTVKTKNLTITGISVSNKQFDGTTTASITGTASYVGLVLGETFAVVGAPTAAFVTPDVGTTKPVTVSGFAAPSANYTVTQPSGLTASITPAVNLDTDEDGLTDGQEVTLGSNPNNALSMPKTKLVYWGPATGVAAANVPANLPSDIVKISAGENFALALSSAGRVYAWGANESGQTNVPAAALSGVVDILAAGGAGNGGGFAYARKADGSVVGWGSSASIGSLPGNIVKMAGWGNQGLLLDSSGRAYQRGPDNLGTASVNSDSAWQSGLTDIGAARYNHIALKAGAARVVGIVNHNSLVVPAEAQANVQSVIAHGGSTLTATLSNNQVVIWGKADSGQISGLRNIVQAGSLPGVSVTRANSGTANSGWEELVLSQSGSPSIRKFFPTQSYWSGLIDKDGKVWVWGNPANGLPTATVPAAMTANVVQAVGGGNFALALVLDQDGDGLADNVETNTGIYVSADNTGTDPTRADTDSDGLSDGAEVAGGTNPLVKNVLRFRPIDMLALGKGNFSIPESNGTGGGVTPIGFLYSSSTNAAYYGGVPFFVTDKANQVWHAARAPGGDGAGAVSETFPIAVNNVYGFYTMAGLWWGAEGSYVTYTFNFSDGSSYSKTLTNNVDLRDYNIPSVWANSINGTTTQNVFSSGTYYLDRQWIDLAAAGHGGKNLVSFTVTDSGSWGSSRIFLAAATAQVGAPGQIPPGAVDTDNDGILDSYELGLPSSTKPDDADTDDDGLSDGTEISGTTDPLVADVDNDQLSDGVELALGTNPQSDDSDSDGTKDGDEDADNDGASNKLEVDLGNSPTVANVYNRLINGSFEDGSQKPTAISPVLAVNQDNVPGWKTTAVNTTNAIDQFKIELWYSGFTPEGSGGSAGGDGSTLAELNYVASETLYQDVVMTVDGAVSYSFLHRGRSGPGADTVEFKIDRLAGGPGSAVEANFFNRQVSTGNGAWVRYRGTPTGTVQAGKTYRFSYSSIRPAGGGGNLLDGASFEIDRDADGLTDSLETNTGTYVSATNTGTDPLDDDTDNDGLKDGEEVFSRGSNPLLADTDGDGLNDNVETKTGTYVSGTDTGTDPTKADTDGDGLNDKVETKTGTFDSGTDTGTDPSVADTDGDGVSDGVEVADGTNPNNIFNFKRTNNFGYTGGFQSFTVPEGVTRISFVLQGADGANFQGSQPWFVFGGQGGTVTGTLTVNPGQTLRLGVGGGGSGNLGGWNGGGSDPFNRGGGGGGATDIFLSNTDWTNLVAIAGGGSGGNSRDGFGGNDAGNGSNNGVPLVGSDGDGGGGGGGYYGGRGGGVGFNGGGGTSWVNTNLVTTSSITGGSDGISNGSIQLRYVVEPVPRITQVPLAATGTVGGAASFSVTAETPGEGTDGLTYQWKKNGEDIPGATGSTLSLLLLTIESEGTYSVTVANAYGSVTSGDADLTVNKATPVIETAPLAGTITYGQMLNQLDLAGGVAKLGALEVEGFFSFDSGDLKPAAGTPEQDVTFTPLDPDSYNSVALKVLVTVNKKSLTVTAENKTRGYGLANPAFTFRYTGLVPGETEITPAPTATTTAALDSRPGSFEITVNEITHPNYEVTEVNGTLTVIDADKDGDGVGDVAELDAGTDPADPADRPVLLSAGWNHTLYLPVPGQHVLAWGLNGDGRCGLGHTNSPVLSGQKGVYRDAGGTNRTLMGLIAVAAGGNHSLVLQSVGGVNKIWAAGANLAGQLGRATNEAAFSAVFQQVPGGLPAQPVAIAAGSKHNLALGLDGRVYTWGDNSQGQLGSGTTVALRHSPAPVPGLINVKAIAAGADHSLALTRDGQVYAWGRGNSGQLGYFTLRGTNVPRLITGIPLVAQIAAGDKHTLIRTEAGEVYACGANTLGQAGLPAATSLVRAPTKLSFPGGAVAIRKLVAGLDRAHAIATDGKVYAWGYNYYGELGLGYATTVAPYGVFGPTEVPALYGSKEIASGGYQTFALDDSGTLAGSGLNNGGQLGVGSTNNVSTAPQATKEAGKLDQAITFTLPGSVFSTATSLNLVATTGSGLNPLFASSDSAVASIDGGLIRFLRAGTVRITASQPGNEFYNAAQPVVRELTVIWDETDPVVALNGPSTVLLYVGDTFTDPGATALDPADGILTDSILVTGSVNTAAAGSYTLTYAVQDAAGNLGQAVRTVVVSEPPPLTLQLAATPAGMTNQPSGTNFAAVDAGLQVLGRPSISLTAATVKIVSGKQTGDTLALAGYIGPITANYNSSSGTLRLSGTTNLAGYQEALRKVVLTTTNRTVTNRVVTMALGAGVAFTNGHVYEYVSTLADWPTARTSAKARQIHGEPGYLANSTSAEENAFLQGLLQEAGKDAWLGGSDTAGTGYRWFDGPEAGTLFWNGTGNGGSAVAGQYSNWGAGEPNDFGWSTGFFSTTYESYAMMTHSTSFVIGGWTRSTSPGKWNDAPIKTSSRSTYRLGSLVEYGASASSGLLFAGSRTVEVIKGVPAINAVPAASALTEGQALNLSTLAGGGATVPGTFAWTDPSVVPGASGNYSVTFTPADAGAYQSVSFEVAVAVNPTATSPFANNVNFTSTASVISVPMPTAALGGMTLEFWLKPASGLGSGTYSVVRKNSPLGSSELSVSLNYSSSTIASLSATVTPAAGSPATASANLIDPLAWNHVALVVSGSSVQFFINGTAGSSAMLMGALALSNQPLVFGSSFRGQIDDIRIYSGVRSGSQISADKTGPALAPYDSSLVAYYKLDEGSGTALADATGVNGAATGGNIGWGPGRSPGVWDITSGDYRLQDDGSSLLLELGGLEGTTLYDQIFVWNGAATLDGIINLMFIGAYTGPVSGSWHTFDLIWAQNGIVLGDDYQLVFDQPGFTVDTAVVAKDGGQLWQVTVREAVSQADLEQAAALAQPSLGIARSPGTAGTVEIMYTYTRPAGGSYVGGQYAANGVRYEVQVSGDLKTWVPAALEEVGAVPAGAGYENVTVKIVSGSPKAFLKLKISN